jgi:signal transduction histidine kinase
MAGGIAHDLNSMLAPILLLAKITARRLPPGTCERENLETISSAADRARNVVKQILAFGRKESVEKVPTNLASIARESLKLLRPSFRRTILLVDQIEDVPLVLANGDQFAQMLINLVTNAKQSISGSAGQVVVSLREGRETTGALEKGSVCLTVTDTGIGMDEAVMACIFDPFFTTKAAGEGTGLGLSVVHGIVTDHGGRIQVRSRPCYGTQFEIVLPALTILTGASTSANTLGGLKRSA